MFSGCAAGEQTPQSKASTRGSWNLLLKWGESETGVYSPDGGVERRERVSWTGYKCLDCGAMEEL